MQIASVDVERSDADALQLDLRKRAMANSQEAAKQIAAAYGMTIKGVYSVSEVAPDFAYGIRAGSWGEGVAQNALAPPPPAPLMGVTVTGSRIANPELRVGTIDLKQDIYAVYLTTP